MTLFKALHPTIGFRGASMLAADIVIPVRYHLFSGYWYSNDTVYLLSSEVKYEQKYPTVGSSCFSLWNFTSEEKLVEICKRPLQGI